MSSLYLHIPFCLGKCPYCDFFSLPAADSADLRYYPDLLLRDLELAARQGWAGPLETVYFGGGTPSLLDPSEVGRLLDAAASLFGLAPGAEITLEANPGTVNRERLEGYRAAGVNRLSLGLQSLREESLTRLGRSHSAADGVRAMGAARAAGFDNLSCDLLFALPEQTAEAPEAELEALVALDPEHLSCYGLTAEPGTPFHRRQQRGELVLPVEEEFVRLYRLVHRHLKAAGYDHYEISNFAQPGRECRHNLDTWRRRPSLGVGAGAHSFRLRGWGERLAVPPDLEAYRQDLLAGRSPARLLERLDRGPAMAEALFLGLRTREGVGERAFRETFGSGVAEAFPGPLARCGDRLRLRDDRWRLDLRGWLIYDHLLGPFLRAAAEKSSDPAEP